MYRPGVGTSSHCVRARPGGDNEETLIKEVERGAVGSSAGVNRPNTQSVVQVGSVRESERVRSRTRVHAAEVQYGAGKVPRREVCLVVTRNNYRASWVNLQDTKKKHEHSATSGRRGFGCATICVSHLEPNFFTLFAFSIFAAALRLCQLLRKHSKKEKQVFFSAQTEHSPV